MTTLGPPAAGLKAKGGETRELPQTREQSRPQVTDCLLTTGGNGCIMAGVGVTPHD
jgi:hypothetical protein